MKMNPPLNSKPAAAALGPVDLSSTLTETKQIPAIGRKKMKRNLLGTLSLLASLTWA